MLQKCSVQLFLSRLNVPIAFNKMSVFFAKFNINIYKIHKTYYTSSVTVFIYFYFILENDSNFDVNA